MTYYKMSKITDWQRQIIIGTVLGGSSLVKSKGARNCYLSMRSNNIKWLTYKAQELNFIESENPYFKTNSGYLRWHSKCSPSLNEFCSLFYKENGQKTVQMETLNELRDIGLSIWFLDGGKIENKCIVIFTSVFKEEGTNIINQYFKEIDLNTKIVNKGGFNIILDEKSSERFAKVIVNEVPQFMYSSLVGL